MHPFIITENIADRIQPAVSPAGVTGFEASHLFDCKKNTAYSVFRNIGQTVTITNSTNDCYGDTFIIYSDGNFPSDTIAITYNSGTTFVTTVVGLGSGMNVFKKATPVLLNQFTVTITAQATNDYRQLSQFWFGLAKDIDPPKYVFDPYEVLQNRNEINNPDLGFFINQVLANKGNLKLTWGDLNDASSSGLLSSTNLQDLKDNCLAYGLPFWYFWNNLKTTEGYLVVSEDKQITMPYQIANSRSLSLNLKET